MAMVLGAASGASAEVKVERVTYLNQPNCIRLSNGTVEVIVTTAIGPRVIRYGFIGGDNLLGEVPEVSVKTALGEWKPWGGHRLWTAPEDMPRSYSPDNGPVEATVTGGTVRLVQPVEPQTGIVKELTVTLADSGTDVTIGHRLTNRSLWAVDVAPWALTIMNAGGTILIPQEPYASHDDALLPVRSLTMWAYTDLSDPRWSLGPKFIRLRTDTARAGSQKIGVANKRGWAGVRQKRRLVRQAVRMGRGQDLPGPRRQHRGLHRRRLHRARDAGAHGVAAAGRFGDARRALVVVSRRERRRRRHGAGPGAGPAPGDFGPEVGDSSDGDLRNLRNLRMSAAQSADGFLRVIHYNLRNFPRVKDVPCVTTPFCSASSRSRLR